MFKLITCTCCGAELTMPQYYKGLPYGYTCIKRVNPARKQCKDKVVLCEVLRDITGAGSTRKVLIVSCADVKVKITTYVSQEQYADDMTGVYYPVNLGTKARPSQEASALLASGANLGAIYHGKI